MVWRKSLGTDAESGLSTLFGLCSFHRFRPQHHLELFDLLNQSELFDLSFHRHRPDLFVLDRFLWADWKTFGTSWLTVHEAPDSDE